MIVGDRDATVSVDESAAAYRALARGELTVLPRTAHPIEQVDGALLAEQLCAFFGAAGDDADARSA